MTLSVKPFGAPGQRLRSDRNSRTISHMNSPAKKRGAVDHLTQNLSVFLQGREIVGKLTNGEIVSGAKAVETHTAQDFINHINKMEKERIRIEGIISGAHRQWKDKSEGTLDSQNLLIIDYPNLSLTLRNAFTFYSHFLSADSSYRSRENRFADIYQPLLNTKDGIIPEYFQEYLRFHDYLTKSGTTIESFKVELLNPPKSWWRGAIDGLLAKLRKSL